jgi:thiamine-monophosphate kinase
MVPRTRAKPGDRICVTGTIGDAALGLKVRLNPEAAKRWSLSRREQEHLAKRYLLPQPRNAMAEALRRHASAAMDVSDGLAGDLAKLCAASGVSASIEASRVPLSAAARKAVAAEPSCLETALTGGDDYEIICTVAPGKLRGLRAAALKADVPLTEIGQVVTGVGRPQFLGSDGKPLLFKALSFSHV